MKRFCGFITGFVFFISGILKLMDPVGAGLVMKEYFKFMHIGFLNFVSLPTGVAFALTETIIGVGLITGVWRKVMARLALILQGLFTLLTLFLVIFNPEMDCGCFGEAVNLSHGETFTKNLILLALLLIYYIPVKHLGQTKKKKYVSFAIVSVSSLAFTLYSLMFIPMADFTDLRLGAEINKATAENTYEAGFVYIKDGIEETFTLETLPDSTWTFVRTEMTTSESDASADNHISIYDDNGNYADSLLNRSRTMIVSVYKDNLSKKDIKKIDTFLNNAEAAGFNPLLLTSGAQIDSRFHYNCDYKTLITLNRSNGGVTYIENGFILRKWANRKLPAPKELAIISKENPTDTFTERDTKTSLAFQGFLLYVFAVMLLL